jgi:hypothetical protein
MVPDIMKKWLHPLFFATALFSVPLIFPTCVFAGEKLSQDVSMATTGGTTTGSNTDQFWSLFKAHDYAGAASAFESIAASGRLDANVVYYAALANQQIYKEARARQLFAYVISAFPNSTQATYAQTRLGASNSKSATNASPPSQSNNSELPLSVQKALPPEMQALLKTDAGKLAVAQSMRDQKANADIISNAECKGVLNTAKIASATPSAGFANTGTPRVRGGHPFSPDQIAREGPNGIDQTNAPNCWFESAMSALAQLPKGQRLISQMISYGEGDSFLVRFPGDGVEYKITIDDLRRSGVNSTALWASLLDYAERQKFPNNVGASGVDADKHRLQVGLGSITGCGAEMIYPAQVSKQDVISFIYGAVSSHNPITAGTAGRNKSVPAPVIEAHAYTIIGFDPSRSMVTIRNPHGRRARRFSWDDDPQHLKFEQLDDGVFKMNVDLFCDSFGSVCRSFI